MTTELALIWLSIIGILLTGLAQHWNERQRMTTIFVLLLVLILAILAVK